MIKCSPSQILSNEEQQRKEERKQRIAVTCYLALAPSCAQRGRCNDDVQAEKHKSPPILHDALRIET